MNHSSTVSDDVASSVRSLGDNTTTRTKEMDMMSLRIRYKQRDVHEAPSPNIVGTLPGYMEYEIRLEVKEEDVMGKQMWVAELQ